MSGKPFKLPQSPVAKTPSPHALEKHQPTQNQHYMKPSNNFDADNTITLLLGPEQRKVIVHASFLTRTSAFFATALKKEWAEGQTRTIKLDEETSELMAHYLDWLYTAALPTKVYGGFSAESTKVAAHNLLAELYVLGERRLDSSFRNAITAEIIRIQLIFHGAPGCRTFQRITSVNTIYQGTPAGSPARRLMVDLSLRFGCPQCYTGDLDNAFLVDLTHAFFVAAQSPKGVDGQRYLALEADDYRI